MRNSAKRIQALQEIDLKIPELIASLQGISNALLSMEKQSTGWFANKHRQGQFAIGLEDCKKRKKELERSLKRSLNQEIWVIHLQPTKGIYPPAFYQECSEEDLVAYMKYYYPDISYVYKKVRTTLPEIKK